MPDENTNAGSQDGHSEGSQGEGDKPLTHADIFGGQDGGAADATDQRGGSQTGDGSSGNDGGSGGADAAGADANGGSSNDDDPTERRIKAEREAALEEGRKLALKELRSEENSNARTQAEAAYKDLFPNAMRDARTTAEGLIFTDADGNQYKLTADQINSILKPFEDANPKAYQAHHDMVANDLADAFFEVLPEESHDAFTEAVDNKDISEWLPAFAEHAALGTEAVKAMTLEQFEALGPKQKAELAKRDEAEFKRGRDKGRNDPPGEPDVGEAGTVTQGRFPKDQDGKIDVAASLAAIGVGR